ncbi:MAG: SigB/SigF/SigG family RNA polymerase sigma factor [Clostridiales Family XIII bacterium]|jgi:RNA polymerase sigma-B factor|nr:SigB/SigF/SigG family RNA polymerase sigma factor [Clostridiales Family XIII bacterium]
MGQTTKATSNKELFEEYGRVRSVELRNEIVEKYLYLVDILIRKYLNKGLDYEDLYQVGAMALVFAVERYDPSKGYEFTSFATPTIIGEIKRYFRDKGWAMKVPRRLKEISAQIPAVKEELYGKLLRNPTVPELAEAMGYSEEDILEAMEGGRAYGTYSLNQPFDDGEEQGDSPSLERFTGIEDQGYAGFENAEIIKKVLAGLSEKERVIFMRRFIHDDTQQQIATDLGVSQMTVSRLEKIIKKKFKAEYYSG